MTSSIVKAVIRLANQPFQRQPAWCITCPPASDLSLRVHMDFLRTWFLLPRLRGCYRHVEKPSTALGACGVSPRGGGRSRPSINTPPPIFIIRLLSEVDLGEERNVSFITHGVVGPTERTTYPRHNGITRHIGDVSQAVRNSNSPVRRAGITCFAPSCSPCTKRENQPIDFFAVVDHSFWPVQSATGLPERIWLSLLKEHGFSTTADVQNDF